MGALDEVIGVLKSQPWAVRCRFAVVRNGLSATLQRGGMLTSVQEVSHETVEVVYEHALHEVTRMRLGPKPAARLLLAVIQRDGLERIEIPEAHDK